MLRYGLKHGIAAKPKENNVFKFAENIFDQINQKGLCKDNLNSVQRLKNTLRSFSFNVLDSDDKSVYRGSKKLKFKERSSNLKTG